MSKHDRQIQWFNFNKWDVNNWIFELIDFKVSVSWLFNCWQFQLLRLSHRLWLSWFLTIWNYSIPNHKLTINVCFLHDLKSLPRRCNWYPSCTTKTGISIQSFRSADKYIGHILIHMDLDDVLEIADMCCEAAPARPKLSMRSKAVVAPKPKTSLVKKIVPSGIYLKQLRA